MSAPFLWIVLPFFAGSFILIALRERHATWIGGTLSIFLALIALLIPIDTALLLGGISIKIAPAFQLFGRNFELNAADAPLLVIVYGLAALWFFGAEASGAAKRFVSLGLMIVALLTASIAVQPFLYAALLLEMAAMLIIPLLAPLYRKPGYGVVRFLIYQTFAMPLILFSGWMLAGVEASPGDLGATVQASILLGLGFAFLFAVFPLYHWVPMLMEETSPYVTAFLLWALPTFTVFFALGFLERYAWLRNSEQVTAAMRFAGVLMVASAGIFAALQSHLGRILGYAAVAEAGLLVILLSLRAGESGSALFHILIPRGVGLIVWALAISILKRSAYSLRFSEAQGLARKFPIACAALILAHLSITGFPLLAGFPPRLTIWQSLAEQSSGAFFWVFLGTLGLLTSALRTMAVLVMADEDATWEITEHGRQGIMLVIGAIGLFVLGLFPQVSQFIIADLGKHFFQMQ